MDSYPENNLTEKIKYNNTGTSAIVPHVVIFPV